MPHSLTSIQVKRGPISTIYNYLIVQHQKATICQAIRGWEKDLGAISEETWQNILEYVSVSPQQSLTKLFILFRAYRTPR